MRSALIITLATLLLAAGSRPAAAHFPWLVVEDGKAIYFFGENPADRTYHLPETLAKAKIICQPASGEAKPVACEKVESDDLVGLVSSQAVAANSKLCSQATYGIYRGSRLNYYTIHQAGPLPKSRSTKATKGAHDLAVEAIDTDSGVDVYVTWKGKPLEGVKVQLFCDKGHEEGDGKTDDSGKVSFNDKQVEDGLNGIMLGHTVKNEAGEFNGKAYKGVAHYLTYTFTDPEDFEKE